MCTRLKLALDMFYYPLISSVFSQTLDLLHICTVVESFFQMQGNLSALSMFWIFIYLFYQAIETSISALVA